MKEIICPIDFSDASLNALEFAVNISEKGNRVLKLVHIITEQEYKSNLEKSGLETMEDVKAKMNAKLKALCNEINENSKLRDKPSCYEISIGDISKKLARYDDAQLIVMGTSGVSDVAEAVMGSNTIKVINESRIPVLVVPQGTPYREFKNIVFSSELDVKDKIFLQMVIEIAIWYDSRIFIVHVTDKKENSGDDIEKYADDLKSYLDYPKLTVEEMVTMADVTVTLEHSLNLYNANLLVMVHKTRSKITGIFHNSLTKTMSYLTNFPLLVLRN